LVLLHILPLAIAAHASFTKLPTGNGFGTAVYDLSQAKVVDLREHAYQSVDQGVATRDLIFDAYFGVRAAGQEAWLTSAPIDDAALDGGVITVKQHYGGVTAYQTFFAPFGVAAPSLLMAIRVKNEGAQAIDDVHVFSLHNLHIGDGDGTQGQRIDWDGATGSFVQRSTGSQRVMIARSLTMPAHHTTNPQNPYDVVNGGGLFTDVDSTGDANDVASGFQWDVGTLAPGDEASFGVLLEYHPFGDVSALQSMATSYLGSNNVAQTIAAEGVQWNMWLAPMKLPPGLSSDEQKLYRQQLAILRMGQSREANDVGAGYLPSGQMLASVRPGHWDIAWVRDGCLAIVALARAGFLDEAQAGLEFMLRASAGGYQQYVGAPYRISVVRYFGKGKEEADSDANGPNIEFDGFGMFLWAVDEFLSHGGESGFLDTWWSTLSTGIADVLVGLIEPQSGLLAADSSIWESHWDNGGREHYTWSDMWASVGLRRAAAWGATRDGVRAKNYSHAADVIQNAITARLVTGDKILRASTEKSTTVDAAAIEAFNQGVIDPSGAIAGATLDAMKANLFLPTGNGYKRNQNGGAYDEQEWVVVDLRTSLALARAGRSDEANALWGWVRDQALANHGLLPELYDHVTADYAGETPMVGFGAGAFVVTAWDRNAPPVPDGGVADASASVDGGGPMSPTGCSCAIGARAPSGKWAWASLILFAAGIFLRRRR
jgi:MYXO-CTERM domain-containing protein